MDMPTKCEFCGATLVNTGTSLYCPNNNCPETVLGRINTWCSVQNIMHVSTTTLRKLQSAGLLADIHSLYELNIDDVKKIDGLGDGFNRILKQLREKNSLTLAKFFAGLDIPDLGEKVLQSIIDNTGISTIDEFYSLTKEKLLSISGIGEATANTVIKGRTDMKDEVENLKKYVKIDKPVKIVGGKLEGKSFCFAGPSTDGTKRSVLEEKVKSMGGKITGVNKALNYLVSSEIGTGKMEAAYNYGTTVISYDKFFDMIK